MRKRYNYSLDPLVAEEFSRRAKPAAASRIIEELQKLYLAAGAPDLRQAVLAVKTETGRLFGALQGHRIESVGPVTFVAEGRGKYGLQSDKKKSG